MRRAQDLCRARRSRDAERREPVSRRSARSRQATGWSCICAPTTRRSSIMRGEHVIFFRNRPEGDDASIADLVHQTAMYYQDRLSGDRFSRVFLGGSGRATGAVESARRSLEERLGASVEPIDPTRVASLTDRISVTPDVMDVLGSLVGMALRTRESRPPDAPGQSVHAPLLQRARRPDHPRCHRAASCWP